MGKEIGREGLGDRKFLYKHIGDKSFICRTTGLLFFGLRYHVVHQQSSRIDKILVSLYQNRISTKKGYTRRV